LDDGILELEQRYGRSASANLPDNPAGRQLRWFGLHVFSALSILMMPGILATARDPSGQVALVYAPGTSLADAVLRMAAAGGRLVRPGRYSWIIVAAPVPGDRQFPMRAREAGALAVLSPWVAGGCAIAGPSFAVGGR
jgi:hypothetical protein